VDATSFSDGFKFTLDDGTGQITLLTWLETYDGIVGREGLRVGAFVQITGAINQFEGALEIVPANGSDVVVVRPGNEQAPERQTGSLTSADIGKRVAVKGEVARAEPFSTGERVYLDDGSGEILLLLWQNVFERIPDGHAARTAGSRLHAIGRVEEYEGTLEIVPALPSDVIILYQAPAATPRPADALVPIGELHAGRIGEKAAIAGQVTDTASFSKGFKFTLDDGTGRITLLAWHNVYDALEEPTFLNMGATVEVVGEISEYEGELQIEPYAARDIKVITPGASSAPPQDTDQTAKHVGKRITIVGQITRVEDTHSGTRVFVGDDTGEALVYIWHNILSRVPSSQSLSNSGTVVRITGKVQEYRGEFEIVPALPYDVEVLE
jgi:DNA/RNA endonuclease YhcR with UshA esterase domain